MESVRQFDTLGEPLDGLTPSELAVLEAEFTRGPGEKDPSVYVRAGVSRATYYRVKLSARFASELRTRQAQYLDLKRPLMLQALVENRSNPGMQNIYWKLAGDLRVDQSEVNVTGNSSVILAALPVQVKLLILQAVERGGLTHELTADLGRILEAHGVGLGSVPAAGPAVKLLPGGATARARATAAHSAGNGHSTPAAELPKRRWTIEPLPVDVEALNAMDDDYETGSGIPESVTL